MLKGGSAKTRSMEPAGRSFMPAMQSPWWMRPSDEAGRDADMNVEFFASSLPANPSPPAPLPGVPGRGEPVFWERACFLPAIGVVLEGEGAMGQYSKL